MSLQPGALDKIRSEGSKKMGTAAFTAKSQDWLEKMRLVGTQFHAEQFSDTVLDLARQLPPLPLHEALEKGALFDSENTSQLQKYFKEHPDALAELEQKLKAAHIDPKFQIAGNGRNGIFLKAGEVVVSIRGDIFNEHLRDMTPGQGKPLRQPVPQHLQNLAYIESGPLNIEITPALHMKNVPVAELDSMVEAIAQTPHAVRGRQWHFNDPAVRNVGHSTPGTRYVLDGNAIGEASSIFGNKTQTKIPTGWLNADGTWKQYTEFKELHEKFNSELHQAGGKLGPSFEALERAATNNKAKWIIGGVVLTGIAIAGVVAAVRHKRSHVETENDRREAQASAAQQAR